MEVNSAVSDRYRTQAPELLDSVVSNGTQTIMRRDAKTDFCVRFSDGICGIHRDYGTDFLGDACFFYPRTLRRLGDRVSMSGTLSCPEVARLALFSDDAFRDVPLAPARMPEGIQDYLPPELSPEQALVTHHAFLRAALDESVSPARTIIRAYSVAESLTHISTSSWPDAAPFYFSFADSDLPPPEPRDTDLPYLLQALCGLVAAAKDVHHARLMRVIEDMQKAMHLSIRWDNLAIAPLPDSAHAIAAMQARWQGKWLPALEPFLRRYLAAEWSLSLFPFAGFGHTLTQKVAILGVRYSTLCLGLMSACSLQNGLIDASEQVRIVQSLSRFLDHLADPEFSIKIYQETGWLQKRRLRALVGDA